MPPDQESEPFDLQLFRDIFNASPIGIAVENLDGQPLFVNPALCSMLGFSEKELRSKHCNDFSPPEDAAKDWELFQQLRSGVIDHYQLEKRYFRRDGSLVWAKLSISLLNNRPSTLVIAMVEDITEKKRAEEARFRHAVILESSEDAIISATVDGVIVGWNAGAQRIYGYTEAEVVGKSVDILVPPELPHEENKILATLRAGGRIEHFETLRITKTGKRIKVALTIFPIRDASGKTVGLSGIARDITERRLEQEALRESEEKFRCVFRDAAVGMVIVSPEGRFLAANEAFCDCLGYREQELLERTVDAVTLPDDWPVFSKRLSEAIANGVGVWRFEKRCLHKNGRVVYTECSASVIRDRTGKPRYLVGGILDVTKRKESEETLSEMARKLVEAQEQERARIGRELHDDINQRLAMLAIELEQLRENPSEVESRAQELRKRTVELSDDVQALSHELHASKLEYLGVVAGIKSWCREFGERHAMEIKFTNDVSTAVPFDIGISLFRVLQESLQNALKHSGVKHVEVELREVFDVIHLVVTDLGRGFDVNGAIQGPGLGLTSMQERVRLVNGTIEIQSNPMGGTTVHVRVPVESQYAPQSAG